MRKNLFQRSLALLLAVLMISSLGGTAFAAEPEMSDVESDINVSETANPSIVSPENITFGDGTYILDSESEIIIEEPDVAVAQPEAEVFSGAMPYSVSMSPSGVEIAKFLWNGSEVSILTNSSNQFSGGSWSCDADGNFSIRFSSNGTITFTKGNFEEVNAHLIGGGAGGNHAEMRKGGAGGEAGEEKTSALNITLNQPYTIKIGNGGSGGSVNSRGVYYPNLGQVPTFYEATNGGDSSITGAGVNVIAAGGSVNGGGAGGVDNAAGADCSHGGGGGGSVEYFDETDSGNFRGYNVGDTAPNYSCHICGYDSIPGWAYSVGGWTVLNKHADSHKYARGGYGSSGSGNGANPGNGECPSCPLQDGGNATAAGGGGGGGAFGTGIYATQKDSTWPHSRDYACFYTNGGDGANGLTEINGKAKANAEVTIIKTSSAPEITDGSSCYSLEGAQYGVYATKSDAENDTNRLAVMTTGADGKAYAEIPYCDTYFIKELVAPKGYALDELIHEASPVDSVVTLDVKDIPLNDPVSIEIYKVDAEGKKVPGTRLDGAEFTINYYNGFYDKSTLPEQPTRHWVIKTVYSEKAGRNIALLVNPECFVSGDDFYRDQFGKIVMPLGTIAVFESKSPDGYKIADGTWEDRGGVPFKDIYVAQIEDGADGVGIKGGHTYTMNEFLTKIAFAKVDEEGNYLAGARLAVRDKATGQIVESWDTTDKPYVIEGKLFVGKEYELVELKAPDGYTIADPVPFTVNTMQEGEQVITMTDKKTEVRLLKVNEKGEPIKGAVLEVQNNNGKTIDKWTSDGTPHVIKDLPVGGNYFFVEITPPAGYGLAEKIPFTITNDYNGIEVTMTDEKVSINTTAHDGKGNHEISKADGTVEIVDTVEFKHLIPKTEYTLTGVLMDKATGEAVKGADGKEITATKTFTPDTPFGTVDVVFETPASLLKGKTVVVFETLYESGKEIVAHTDIKDADQTVYFPEIKTTATDADGKHITKATENITITDVVEYSGLIPNKEYTLTGTLMRKSTGKSVIDADGHEITSSVKFTPAEANGTVSIEFTFNGNLIKGDQVVAFETVSDSEREIAIHHDINDENQTVAIPEITTEASCNGSHAGTASKNTIIKDRVSYKGLIPNVEYTLNAALMLSSNAPVIDASGNAVTKQVKFTPAESNGEIEVEFEIDARKLKGETVVVFESLIQDKIEVAVHADLNDEAQTIYFSKLNTTATDRNGNKDIKPEGIIEIVDKVEYNNLVRGAKYELIGTLMDKATEEAVIGADGQPITVTQKFTSERNGSVEMVFTINADEVKLAGRSFVVFEQLNFAGKEIANHTDINDEGQTVHFPEIKTTAADAEGNKDIMQNGSVTIVDEVVYSNLIPNKEYTLNGVLIFKDTGKSVIGEDGHEITSSTKFTPAEADGTVKIEFTVDSKLLAGKAVVAFETVMDGDREVAIHHDINDADQTVYFPDVKTIATIQGEHIAKPNGKMVLVDRIEYFGLIPNQEYTIQGVLMDKESGEPITVESKTENASSIYQVMARTTFTPEASNGVADITFEFDGKALEGKSVVAFETLYNNDRIVAEHKDIADENQTVHFPQLKTTATDAEGNKHLPVQKDVIVKDVVHYENLLPNKTYTIKGVLMDKETNAPVLDKDGAQIVSEATLKLEDGDKTSGEITLEFTVDASVLAGKTIVVFENMYLNELEVAAHADIEDADQSVYVPAIKTTLTDKHNAHSTNLAEKTVLTDKVEYKNLIPNQEYTMTGKLMYLNSENKVVEVKDSNGQPITDTKTFTPEAENGFVEMTFKFNSMDSFDKTYADFTGRSVIAFESLTSNGVIIVTHEDIMDEGQTVHFPEIHTTATGENGKHIAEVPADATEVKVIDKVEYKNLIPNETYKVSGTIHNVADGAPLKDADGKVINVEKEFVPEAADGFIEVEFVLNAEDVKGKTLVVFENLMYGVNTIAVHADLNDKDQTVTIPHTPYGIKQDASNAKPLEGAKFTVTDNGLYDTQKHIITEKTPAIETQSVFTDKNGHISFNALPEHHYTVQEIIAPEGYILDSHTYSVYVDGTGKLFTINEKNELVEGLVIRNVHGGTVVISKTDLITGRPVEGCEVAIYAYVKKGLTATDEGYMVPVDPDDPESMKAAGVEDKSELEKVEVFRQTTDKKGRIYFFTDKPGKYFYRELKAANGYYLNEDEFSFIINEDLSVKGDTHFTNIPYGTAVIRKVDKEGKPLKGCQIRFFDENNRPLGSGVTDDKGRVYFVSPGPGKYYFVETKAPEGYALVKDHFHFEIAEDFTISGQLTFVNDRIPGMPTKTGDNSNIAAWIALATLGIIGSGTAAIVIFRKKKHDTEQ